MFYPACRRATDVAFLVDHSSDVTAATAQLTDQFVRAVIDVLGPSWTGIRTARSHFSETAVRVVQNFTGEAAIAGLDVPTRVDGNQREADVERNLDNVIRTWFSSLFIPSAGDRSEVQDVIVIVVHGRIRDRALAWLADVEVLKADGVKVITIGVSIDGRGMLDDLSGVASNASEARELMVSQAAALMTLKERLISMICGRYRVEGNCL